MPFLFNDVPKLKTLRQQASFRRLVLEDYYFKHKRRLVKQRRKQQEKRQKQREQRTQSL